MASVSPTRAASGQANDAKSLMRQNQELRDRLQEEASLYRRRLDTYKQAQQNQAALVGRLQSKVLQYKQKCNDLEGRLFEPSATPMSTHKVRDKLELRPFHCFMHGNSFNYFCGNVAFRRRPVIWKLCTIFKFAVYAIVQ